VLGALASGGGEDQGPVRMKNAAVSYVKNLQGLILCVTRKGSFDRWTLPGGKQDPGETLAETQARELYEETGVFTYGAVLAYEALSVDEPDRMVYVYRVTWYGGEPRSESGARVGWLTRQDLLRFSPYRAFYMEMFGRGAVA
jgi:ADP-ribose pyrophosphatase YjhB (NUDIX family)